MVETLEVGKMYNFDIVNITTEKQGVAFYDNEFIVFIDGVNDDDAVVKAEVKKVFEYSALAVKKSRRVKADINKPSDSPYGMDDGDGDEPEDDFDDEDDDSDDDDNEED